MCEGDVSDRRPCLDAVSAGGAHEEGGGATITSALASRGYSIKGLLQKPKPHTSILLAVSRSGAPVAVKVCGRRASQDPRWRLFVSSPGSGVRCGGPLVQN
jgi:hypothetical protein